MKFWNIVSKLISKQNNVIALNMILSWEGIYGKIVFQLYK